VARYRTKYRVYMKRGFGLKKKIITHANSPAQAGRFAKYRQPGYKVVRVAKD